MDDNMKRLLFRDMLISLERVGKCSQDYHELGTELGLIDDVGYAYALPMVEHP